MESSPYVTGYYEAYHGIGCMAMANHLYWNDTLDMKEYINGYISGWKERVKIRA